MGYSSVRKYVIDNEKLMSEWDWDKNNEIGFYPDELTCGSEKKAWWICDKGHEWKSTVHNRIQGNGCPHCAGRYFGDKKYIIDNEELMKEWDWEKNNELGLNPEKITHGSEKKAWWICNNGHRWNAMINSRNKGCKCPYCTNKKVLIGYNDLDTINPELAKQWHPTKNGSLTPKDVTNDYHNKVWWVCDKGHDWNATIYSRNKGRDCPHCNKSKVKDGVNDLATINPEVAKQWHPTKNGDLTPKDVAAGSNEKAWWICDKGHEWKAAISSRSRGSGCPHCSKEKHTSFAEQAIYFYCKKYTTAINRYIESGKEIDIYLPEYNVGIEYNGNYWHKDRKERDKNKIKYFADKGIRIITVKESNKNFIDGDIIVHNRKDKNTINFVIKTIFDLLCINYEEPDVNRDEHKIYEQYVDIEKENSIAVKCPKSIKEWNYEKNGNLLPTMVSYGSTKSVWWKCEKCGYEWKLRVVRYSKHQSCLKCARKKQMKQVRCIETGIVYESITKACVETGIQGVSAACNGKIKTAGGYHWEFVDEELKNKAEKNKLKNKNKNKNKNKIDKRVKPVLCIETGVVYESIKKASAETGIKYGGIAKVCNGKQEVAGGYHWEFVDEELKNKTSKFINKYNKPVVCIDTGIVYKSAKEIERKLGISHASISNVCNKKQKTAGGYHWEFVNSSDINSIKVSEETKIKIKESKKGKKYKKSKRKDRKKVHCIETGIVYESIYEAMSVTGIRKISEVCNGQHKTAGGYHWEFIKD